ncbi:MAG: hypothetical protein ACRDRI_21180 [Pseudonocardiaceae bacterium]
MIPRDFRAAALVPVVFVQQSGQFLVEGGQIRYLAEEPERSGR